MALMQTTIILLQKKAKATNSRSYRKPNIGRTRTKIVNLCRCRSVDVSKNGIRVRGIVLSETGVPEWVKLWARTCGLGFRFHRQILTLCLMWILNPSPEVRVQSFTNSTSVRYSFQKRSEREQFLELRSRFCLRRHFSPLKTIGYG
jgi:hypothetical protein